jgi:hypothetical protein
MGEGDVCYEEMLGCNVMAIGSRMFFDFFAKTSPHPYSWRKSGREKVLHGDGSGSFVYKGEALILFEYGEIWTPFYSRAR